HWVKASPLDGRRVLFFDSHPKLNRTENWAALAEGNNPLDGFELLKVIEQPPWPDERVVVRVGLEGDRPGRWQAKKSDAVAAAAWAYIQGAVSGHLRDVTPALVWEPQCDHPTLQDRPTTLPPAPWLQLAPATRRNQVSPQPA